MRKSKGDRPLVVILGREIREHLGRFLAGLTSGPVFPGKDGQPITSRHAGRRLQYWCARAGIEARVSPHVLRHCFGMRVYARTGDLLLTQAALGHASIASTCVYARADRERLRAALGA